MSSHTDKVTDSLTESFCAEAMMALRKDTAWMIRHALGKNHLFLPDSCSGCRMIRDYLRENPE